MGVVDSVQRGREEERGRLPGVINKGIQRTRRHTRMYVVLLP
jgi:hypothetical protein